MKNSYNKHLRAQVISRKKLTQAAACDGQVYDITFGKVYNRNHGTFLPLFQEETTTKNS